jgi:hypothetical protein
MVDQWWINRNVTPPLPHQSWWYSVWVIWVLNFCDMKFVGFYVSRLSIFIECGACGLDQRYTQTPDPPDPVHVFPERGSFWFVYNDGSTRRNYLECGAAGGDDIRGVQLTVCCKHGEVLNYFFRHTKSYKTYSIDLVEQQLNTSQGSYSMSLHIISFSNGVITVAILLRLFPFRQDLHTFKFLRFCILYHTTPWLNLLSVTLRPIIVIEEGNVTVPLFHHDQFPTRTHKNHTSVHLLQSTRDSVVHR